MGLFKEIVYVYIFFGGGGDFELHSISKLTVPGCLSTGDFMKKVLTAPSTFYMKSAVSIQCYYLSIYL